MSHRLTFWTRMTGALALCIAGYGAGRFLWPELETQQVSLDVAGHFQTLTITRFLVSVSFALFGFAFGYLLAPLLLQPLRTIALELQETPPERLIAATLGLSFGLLLSALLAIPLAALPAPFGQYLPFIVALALAYFGATLAGSDPDTYLGPFRDRFGFNSHNGTGNYIVLDTSVIIDGRIADVAETGFIAQALLVPRFVLAELQQIADSSDPLRRNRGRRGLEVLNRLQRSEAVRVEITDRDPGGDDVDRKLMRLAEELRCPIMTNDFNLNRVAEIQGRRVLNLNELANAVKTLLLPGETISLEIIQEGKEFGQGVGYLDDGTMVVVEDGREHIGQTVAVTVSRVLQTVAGRMIFATPEAARPEVEIRRH
jgi:uncharacterized protein YacL